MSRLRAKLTFSNVVAVLALFVALTGGALAAGNAFVNSVGVIQGCVGKGGALTVVKAGRRCAKHTTSLAFDQTGPRGLPGSTGSPGAAGAADAYQSYAEGPTDFTATTSGFQQVVALSLPAGSWTVTAKVEVVVASTTTDISGEAAWYCRLVDGTSSDEDFDDGPLEGHGGTVAAGDYTNFAAAMPLQLAFRETGPTTIDVECQNADPIASTTYTASDASIDATQVQTIN
jgi:hypothetical protein